MAAAGEGKVIECHTKEEFDAQMDELDGTEKLVVIFFWSPTFPPCLMIAPVFDDCAKENDPTKAAFLKVNVYEVEEVADSYRIQADPTFDFIRDGLTLERFVGAFPDKLRKTIKEFIDYDTLAFRLRTTCVAN